MALKNLFDMVKADRYTADGREAIIKAQEEETEDKVYQIGEISQKTGLQKTANGWVKPKNGKQPGAKKEEPKNVHGAEVDKIYERQLKRIKELKAKGFTDEQIDNDKIIKQTKEDMKNVGKKPESKPGRDRPALKKEDHVKLAKEVLSNTSATDPGWTAEEIAKEWKLGKADAEEVKKEFDNLRKGSSGNKTTAESKPAAKEPKLKEGVMNSRKAKAFKPELEEIRKTDPSRFRENLMDILSSWTDENEGYLKNSSLTNLMNIYNYERNQMYETGDAAPRVLTGDTRIHVRKA